MRRPEHQRFTHCRVPSTLLSLTLLGSTVMLLCSRTAEAACETEALKYAAASTETDPADLMQVEQGQVQFPHIDVAAYAFKFADKNKSAIHLVYTSTSCDVVDFEELLQADLSTRQLRYGKKTVELASALASMNDTDQLRVSVWFGVQSNTTILRPEPGTNATHGEVDLALTSMVEAQKQHLAVQMEPVVGRILSSFPDSAPQFSATLPTASLTLTKRQVYELERWTEVIEIEDGRPQHILLLDRARIATGASYADSSWGLTGSGVKVGIIENNLPTVVNNPYLPVWQTATANCGGNYPHAISVGGVIASTHSTYHGIAPGVQLWAGCASRTGDEDLAFDNALNAGVRVINISLAEAKHGVVGTFARKADYLVREYAITVVPANGNIDVHNPSGLAASPGSGYNVIGVGGYQMGSGAADTMWSGSVFQNPSTIHGDHEKPDLVAPTDVKTLSSNTVGHEPWIGDFLASGTSMAAPMVAGAAALLMQQKAWLKAWPESLKALVMAATDKNIEGNSRRSDKDGAGALSLHEALLPVVSSGISRYHVGGQTIAWWCSQVPSEFVVGSAYLQNGYKTRVGISWTSSTFGSDYAQRPSADFDLRVRRVRTGGYDYVAGSYSWDSTAEIAEFVPSVNGTYEFLVVNRRCTAGGLSPRHIGVAWWQK